MTAPLLDWVVDSPDFRRLRRLLSMLGDDEAVGDALVLAPDFAFMVLAEANSRTYSGGTPIATLERAVVLLGRRHIREMAASVATRPVEETAIGRDWFELVAHCAAVATGAAMMARAAQLPLVEEAKTIGALHDLGMHLMFERDREAYGAAIRAASETSSRVVDHERLHCGTDHGEAAEALFRQAGLPESMCAAVSFHHDPLGAPCDHRYLTSLVFAGECLARRALESPFCGPETSILGPRVLATLRIGPTVIEAYVPLFQAEVDRLRPRRTSARETVRSRT